MNVANVSANLMEGIRVRTTCKRYIPLKNVFLWMLGQSLDYLYRLLPSYRSPHELRINKIFFKHSPDQAELLAMLQKGFSGN